MVLNNFDFTRWETVGEQARWTGVSHACQFGGWVISLVRLSFLLCALLSGHAHAARIALVIGNSAYPNDALRNPVNDARAMEQKLGSLDFKVERIDNFKRDQIGRILTGFSGRIKPGDEVVVFYAGHGVQIKGINYLPAVDAKIESEEDVPLNSLNLNALMDRIDESKAGLKLLFLDACRNNPYARSFRSLDRGLARVSNAPSGTLIHFATRPGSVADDGRGANGLYTTQLLKHIDTPGLPVELMLKRVAASVTEETKGQQEPWIEGSIRGDFFFKSALAEPFVSPVLVSSAEIQKQAWEAVRTSNTLAGYNAFLTEYPNGPYSGAARVAKAAIPDPVALANERDARARAEAERLARAETERRRLDLEASQRNKSGSENTGQEKPAADRFANESAEKQPKDESSSSSFYNAFLAEYPKPAADRFANQSAEKQPKDESSPSSFVNPLGLIVSDLGEERRTQLRIKGGVLVDGAARAGIQTGDVLLALDNIDITGSKQFNELAARLNRTRAHVLLIRRGDSAQFVPIRPEAR